MGLDPRGDEAMVQLARAGNADTCHTPDTRPPRDKPGRVVSSTPFTTGCHDLPPLSESPIPASQW